jgi:FtsP/CotA-like multicopper oxidase with cupredoxin domain
MPMKTKPTSTEATPQRGISRRDLLKITAATGAAAAASIVAAPETAQASGGGSTPGTICSGLQAIEAFPTSPLILNPFSDPLPVPKALAPVDPAVVAGWSNRPSGAPGCQDCDGGSHQLWPGMPGTVCETMPQPKVYQIKLQVAAHSFSSSPVRTLVPYKDVNGKTVPAGTVLPKLPDSTIYGFNGQFPGPMINAEYGTPNCVRFENHLDENPLNLDRGDFGDPGLGFLTHLHNAHTACESDGNPHHKPDAYQPGGWVDNLYLNYPAGGDEAEKQSFFWYHDHREGHTGANVYKGMAGLYPIYDPVKDSGDENTGLRLPGVRRNKADGSFDVDYDLPIVLGDVALDDGAVPHQDFHNGCGEAHPEQWGKAFFRHFPNHGFIGDVFTVNGKAYPVLTVSRRKYRLRFLTAAIARQFELVFMKSAKGPQPAVSLGYGGAELQGQYRLTDGKQCLRMTQIASGGGLLPNALVRDTVENWPAMRHEVVVDFTRLMDGTATRKGDVIYLTNICKMPDGRLATNNSRVGLDPKYVIPLLKIVIGDDAPDNSLMPAAGAVLRPQPALPDLSSIPTRTFELQRGSFGGETQWLINGHPFDMSVPLATVKQGQPEIWVIKNGGGGWTHPMHLHMEEHHVVSRNGKVPTTLPGHQDDTGKDDVIALDPSETVVVVRNFRTFTGKYVAHCHNLAHEDHAMMFGWVLAK